MRIVSPEKMFLVTSVGYIAILAISPLVVAYPLGLDAAFFLLVLWLSFFLGCLFVRVLPRRRSGANNVQATLYAKYSSKTLFLVNALAILGISLRIYDRFFVRGIDLFGWFDDRELLMEQGGNIFATLGGIFYPFCYLGLFLATSGPRQSQSKLLILFSTILFFYPSFDAIISSSRSVFVFNLIFYILILIYRERLRFRFFHLALISISAVGIFIFLGHIFLTRLSAMEISFLFSAYNSVYAFTVKPSPYIIEMIRNSDGGFLYLLMVAWLHISQYLIHGIFEFGYLYHNFVGNHQYGAMQFWIYLKAMYLLMDEPVSNDFMLVIPRTGTFTTAFGPVFIDFGILSPIFLFLLGVGSRLLYQKSLSKSEAYIPLYFFVVIFIILSPMINLFVSAHGAYVLVALLLFPLFARPRFVPLAHVAPR